MGGRRRWLLVMLVALVAGACSTAVTGTTAVPGPATTGFDLQGHRGARGLQPENTLPAFEAALDLGVTTLEMDLHLTADGVVVVWHDPVVDAAKCGIAPASTIAVPDPSTGVAGDLALARLTRAQLSAYRCDRNPDPARFPEQSPSPTPLAGDAYGIPTLAEVFQFVRRYAAAVDKSEPQRQNAGAVRFNIETKRVPGDPATIGDEFDGENPGPFELAVLAVIDEFGLMGRVTIQSFDHRSLQAIRTVNQEVGVAALTRRDDGLPAGLAGWGATAWSPDFRAVTAARVTAAHEDGILVVPWTVNDPADMEELIALGVDGLITDRPDLARAVLP
jgi:glycerophosphoryl diester phosphodiesterase